MAQRGKTKQGKSVPAYSADAMALHLVGGLLLIALGVMIFLAVVISMSGDVFAGMRQVCRGLTGGLAFLLPAVPIWGGILVIMSTQRKAPLRAYGLFCLLLLMALAIGNLLATTGNPAMPLMEYFANLNQSRSTAPDAFDLFLARSYELGARSGMGGGLFGMLLAWPLWKLMGVIPSVILLILLAVVDFLFLIHLDFGKVWARLRGKADERRAMKEQEQQNLRNQELMWQKQREMAARAAVQPALLPQGAPAVGSNTSGWENYIPQGAQTAVNQGYGSYAPPARQTQQQPQTWQTAGYQQANQRYARPVNQGRHPVPAEPAANQVGFQPTMEEQYGYGYPPKAEETGRKSRIFGGKKNKAAEQERQSADAPWQEAEEEPPRKSRIFGGRKASRGEEEPLHREAQEQPYEMPTQADAPAQPYAQDAYDAPENHVTAEKTDPRQKQPASDAKRPPVKTAAQTAPAWEDDSEPSRTATWRQEDDWQAEDYKPAVKAPAKASRQETRPAAPRKQQPTASWAETPPWEDAPAKPAVAEVRTPVLQQEPPKDAWKPELKLPPRKSAPVEEQEEMELPPPYVYPGMNLLKQPELQAGISPEEDAMRSQRLEETLQSFKVPAKVRHVTHGPAISRFELELAAGIKVTKVTDLGKNIAMNMEVKSVRIEAPIPGKSLVGVEVPNRKVSTVTLREVLESQPMQEAKSPLVVALGKDIAGTPIVCDLARMPHLLIAGATGSGKSVCINTMINSLLFRCSPREVRMILVDPKVVELQCYNGIPHLLIPVVSDPHKAAGALAWAVAEMMDRYKKFQVKGVRAIDGYNAKLEDGEEFMPRIVIIIDELADLMMTCKREVEDHICRLAQLARAAGIHLVVATQRPSVDVITGLIKANIPSRIAFKVSSFIDSRTILDRVGAEQLLGWGDMLYLPTGEFTPIRVQGCFLSDGEVNRITDFIRENCDAEYDPDVMDQLDQLEREAGGGPSADMVEAPEDPNSDSSLLAQCIEMAVNDGQVSTSLLQRRLKVGYARAGRLVDEMEKRGVVSAKDGAKPRMCLITREEFERMKESGEIDN